MKRAIRRMKGKYNKRDIINLGILTVMYMIIIFCIVRVGNIYGSQLDWENQHWVIPEYLRNRFYKTGELFPNFAFETGGGQNIYYFAYYGLHSPFLYLSYLLPFINMRSYIIGINIIAIFAAIGLLYIWLRGKYSTKVSFFTTVLFLTSSPLIFHSHRHIMFVDYMPFLILMLIFVRRYMKRKGGLFPVIISALLVTTTSFFFSVGAFVAVGIYAVMLHIEDNECFKLKECIKNIMPVICAVLTAVLMAGVLLLPTALGLLSGRTGAASEKDYGMFLPDIRADFILYGTYSMGLSAFSFYALIAAIMKKERQHRLLAVIIAVTGVFPIVVYMLNGGLYLDGKVLIPFLPISMLLTAEFFKSLFLREKVIKSVLVTGTLINIVIFFTGLSSAEKTAHLAEVIPLLISFIIYYRKLYSYIVCIPVCIISFVACIIVNLNDNVIEYNYKETVADNTVMQLVQSVEEYGENIYRFANSNGRWRNINRVFGENYYQATIYSSTCNKFFKDFYLNQMKNELTYRNNASLATTENVLYNIYMGARYYISESAFIPQGYEKLANKNSLYLYETKEAYPIGYAITKAVSEEEYDKLIYPYTVGTFMGNAVVDEKKCNIAVNSLYETGIREITPEYTVDGNTDGIIQNENGYRVELKKDKDMYLRFKKPLEGKILFITFDVNNNIGGKSEDVYVTVNGTRNKLTEVGWKYHNENYTFEYVISAGEEISSIYVKFSKGLYDISNVRFYEMDYDYIVWARSEMDELMLDKDKTKGDVISGTIDVSEDSWFQLTIPYDEGFSIKIDGKETEYYNSDKDFIGFNITKGKHIIDIEYTAPGFVIGSYMSVAGMVAALAVLITDNVLRIKKCRKRKEL